MSARGFHHELRRCLAFSVLCAALVFFGQGCQVDLGSSSSSAAATAIKSVTGESDIPGSLFNAGWLGRARFFSDHDDGLIFYWMPPIRRTESSRLSHPWHEVSPDLAMDISYTMSLSIIMIGPDGSWKPAVAHFYPEPWDSEDVIVPCAPYPLLNENDPHLERFTVSNALQPGTRILVLAADIRKRSGLIEQTAGVDMFDPSGNVPLCLDSDDNMVQSVLNEEYYKTRNDKMLLLMNFNIYFQIPACTQWYEIAHLVPAEFQLKASDIAPMPVELFLHTQDFELCHRLSGGGR